MQKQLQHVASPDVVDATDDVEETLDDKARMGFRRDLGMNDLYHDPAEKDATIACDLRL